MMFPTPMSGTSFKNKNMAGIKKT